MGIPPIRRKFELLSDRDQNLFLRKCVSIVHCWFICSLILYLQFNPALCEEGWSKFSQIWIGFLWTDLFLGLLTKTAGLDDICHHILYGFVHLMIYKLDAGCFAFGILQYRYYADFFNQNMQLRLMLAMFGLKKSKIYFWNNRMACWGFFSRQNRSHSNRLVSLLSSQHKLLHVHRKHLLLRCHDYYAHFVRLAKHQLVFAIVRELLQFKTNKDKLISLILK